MLPAKEFPVAESISDISSVPPDTRRQREYSAEFCLQIQEKAEWTPGTIPAVPAFCYPAISLNWHNRSSSEELFSNFQIRFSLIACWGRSRNPGSLFCNSSCGWQNWPARNPLFGIIQKASSAVQGLPRALHIIFCFLRCPSYPRFQLKKGRLPQSGNLPLIFIAPKQQTALFAVCL